MLTEWLRNSLDAAAIREGSISFACENAIGKQLVLLGEASHGTHEYYDRRIGITKELLLQDDFGFVAVEGDWPSCFEINRYVKGRSRFSTAGDALVNSFQRWPRWMWVNEDVREFVEWLREYNSHLPEGRKAWFYGLDVYSLWESLDMLVRYFQGNREALDQVYRVYECFQPYHGSEHRYAEATYLSDISCEQEATKLLERILFQRHQGGFEADLTSIMNALVVKNAEQYYRSMMMADDRSWNVRDRHMDSVLAALEAYFSWRKAIVWEHNTHVGDARATDMSAEGMVNLGQLARERLGKDGVHVLWFGSYQWDVIAGRNWWVEHEAMRMPPAHPESWEGILHEYGGWGDLLLRFDGSDPELLRWRGHRAIGVVYHPEREAANYVSTRLSERYDAFWFIDRTHALTPIAFWGKTDEIETYPSGV